MVRNERKARAPNLDGRCLSRAVGVIGAMEGVPTWAGIIRALEAELGFKYTRQALASHPCIAAAYAKRRNGVGPTGVVRMSTAARRREEATRRRNDVEVRLRHDLEAARERMVRWAYNAFVNSGLDETILDRPLPPKQDHGGARAQVQRGGRDWRKRK